MIARITAGWFAVATSFIVSFFFLGLSRWLQVLVDRQLGGKPLPMISTWFYSPGIWPYFFPTIGAIIAVYCTIRARQSDSAWLLCTSVCFGTCFVFLAFYAFSVALPFLPMKISSMGEMTP